MTRIAIVGNAPSSADYADDIDASDIVVRFNNAHGFGQQNGSKIDDLYLVNCGGQPVEWLRTDSLWRQPHVVAAPLVTLPIAGDPKVNVAPFDVCSGSGSVDGLNLEAELTAKLLGIGKLVQTLPRQTYLQACGVVSDPQKADPANEPSTGFVAIYYRLHITGPGDIISLFGFGFAGWQGHAWQRERAWVAQQQSFGRLVWHDPHKGR